MPDDSNPAAQPAARRQPELDARRLQVYAGQLADGIEQALPAWVTTNVERLLIAYRGRADAPTLHAARAAGERAAADIGARVRDVLTRDVDEQRENPLAIVRSAVRYPTEVLQQAEVPPVVRDSFAEKQFPDDLYDLTPATFADLDPSLHDVGLRWGAAKAFVHKARHRTS